MARNAELAVAERKLEAARAEAQAVHDQGARDLEAAERRHRADLAKEAAEREKLRRRELMLEVRRGQNGRDGGAGGAIPPACHKKV